jgi:hypothetical protein
MCESALRRRKKMKKTEERKPRKELREKESTEGIMKLKYRGLYQG